MPFAMFASRKPPVCTAASSTQHQQQQGKSASSSSSAAATSTSTVRGASLRRGGAVRSSSTSSVKASTSSSRRSSASTTTSSSSSSASHAVGSVVVSPITPIGAAGGGSTTTVKSGGGGGAAFPVKKQCPPLARGPVTQTKMQQEAMTPVPPPQKPSVSTRKRVGEITSKLFSAILQQHASHFVIEGGGTSSSSMSSRSGSSKQIQFLPNARGPTHHHCHNQQQNSTARQDPPVAISDLAAFLFDRTVSFEPMACFHAMCYLHRLAGIASGVSYTHDRLSPDVASSGIFGTAPFKVHRNQQVRVFLALFTLAHKFSGDYAFTVVHTLSLLPRFVYCPEREKAILAHIKKRVEVTYPTWRSGAGDHDSDSDMDDLDPNQKRQLKARRAMNQKPPLYKGPKVSPAEFHHHKNAIEASIPMHEQALLCADVVAVEREVCKSLKFSFSTTAAEMHAMLVRYLLPDDVLFVEEFVASIVCGLP